MIERAAPEPQHRAGVLVADEVMLVRAGLRAVIETDAAFHVVAEAADGEQAIETATALQPALAVIGSHGPPLDSVEITRRLRESCPSTGILVLARLDDDETPLASLRAGALGVLRAGVERAELLSGLRRALAGESVVDPALATALMTRMAGGSDLPARALPDGLTPRETEILRLIARGHTNREIAGRLILAVGTIKVHIEHILDKLGVSDRTQAAVRAVEMGIAVPHDTEPARDPGPRAA